MEEAVKIDYGEIGTCTLEATPSATIMSMFQDTVDAYPNQPALGKESHTNNSMSIAKIILKKLISGYGNHTIWTLDCNDFS